MNASRFLQVILPLFLLLGAVYAWVVPPGEAPDEPAHLAYVDHIVEQGGLPPAQPSRDLTGYESYQPPLDYLVSAGLLRMLHGGPVAYPFAANPEFNFQTSGSRAFLPQPQAESQAQALRQLRMARLFWGLLTLWCTFQVANLLVDREWAVAAAVPFCLAPQFLFDTATINNDTAVIAFASATIYGLCWLVSRSPGLLPGLLTGGAAGLALWSKSSALFLIPPLFYVVIVLWRRGQRRAVAGLLLAYAALTAGWIAFTMDRSGPLLVSSQTESAAASGWLRLITEPAWPASVWISFWGKLGWLNLKLPAPIYLFFLPPTVLALWGGISALRQRSTATTVALLAVVSNLGLFVAYLGGVDWQLQGR
ncbi:MAG TPA: glycosyltransferase family 39 protein, partial [Thermoanaerobaculia bacterium]|nr:glycosyltransferase family 39 protein [Thermoanaerobaculia bacterium]